MKSASSFGAGSYLNQSQKTGLSGSVSGKSSAAGNSSDEEEGTGLTNLTRAIDQDPMIQGLEKLFDDTNEELNLNGDAKISYLRRVLGKKHDTD